MSSQRRSRTGRHRLASQGRSSRRGGRPTTSDSGDEARTLGDVPIDRFVAGGVGLGRDEEGRVVLVEGAVPGDIVDVTVTKETSSLIRGRVSRVLAASPDRVEPPCPEVAKGCGGCDLQHVESARQQELKSEIVVDALARIGRLEDVEVSLGPVLPPFGYRTTVRCGVDPATGRLGFRRRHSHGLHIVDDCMTAHPLLREVITDWRFRGATEVMIRAGVATGELMVRSCERTGSDARWRSEFGESQIHEVVAGHSFAISADSFFQARPDGAEVLVETVRSALVDFEPTRDRLADLYGGVGLFSAGLSALSGTLVEGSRSALKDARVNLVGSEVSPVRARVEEWKPVAADVVVADPPRAGLGVAGVEVVVGTGARRVALVSCDPAAMARDLRLLSERGYEVRGVEVIDMFPQTHHVETVARLDRR